MSGQAELSDQVAGDELARGPDLSASSDRRTSGVKCRASFSPRVTSTLKGFRNDGDRVGNAAWPPSRIHVQTTDNLLLREPFKAVEQQRVSLAGLVCGKADLYDREQIGLIQLGLRYYRARAGKSIAKFADLGRRPPSLRIARLQVIQREIAQGREHHGL